MKTKYLVIIIFIIAIFGINFYLQSNSIEKFTITDGNVKFTSNNQILNLDTGKLKLSPSTTSNLTFTFICEANDDIHDSRYYNHYYLKLSNNRYITYDFRSDSLGTNSSKSPVKQQSQNMDYYAWVYPLFIYISGNTAQLRIITKKLGNADVWAYDGYLDTNSNIKWRHNPSNTLTLNWTNI